MKKTIFTKSFVVMSLAAVLALPAVASAGNNASIENTSIKVSFADLDISNADGVSALYKRLQNASEEACGSIANTQEKNLSALTRNKSCYQETLSSAVEKVDNDSLRDLHNS
jgi:UrcA family protein